MLSWSRSVLENTPVDAQPHYEDLVDYCKMHWFSDLYDGLNIACSMEKSHAQAAPDGYNGSTGPQLSYAEWPH